ncbi:Translation factor pelota [Dispira simplex]|nr:Translation factor pelota [Dispira simplex]
MKLVNKQIERDRSGQITLCPEESEDMWHIYNIIQLGDHIKASTIRRVTTESATGSVESARVRVNLTIAVTSVDFDPQASALHINGKNVQENRYVKLGAFHTLDLELNRNFTLYKPEWDTFAMERVKEACDVTKQAEAAAIVLQEGLANICLLTGNMTITRQRIESPVPRKRRGSTTNYEKGLARFYEQVYRGLLMHINFDVVKVVIIASPGFVKIKQRGHKHALQEVLDDQAVQNKLADTKAARETRALDEFYKLLNDNPDRAYYGYDHVVKASENGAIDQLLITDELFRAADVKTRRQYNALVESVREYGGKVLVFSTLHVSGEQLAQLTGVAACLKYPLPGLDESNESNDSDSDDGS